MIKITILILTLFFTGCLNKHGISAQYYSECKEYYDLQGYYHKKCGEDDLINYKEAQQKVKDTINKVKNKIKSFYEEETTQPIINVW